MHSSSLPPAAELDHPLVARYAAFDLGGSRTVSSDDDEDDDDFQANPPARKDDEEVSHNLTICALIPGESRFLPEWLLYHRLLGVDHFVLYDTSTGAAVGGERSESPLCAFNLIRTIAAAEVDGLADRMEAEGKGELGPTADEIKAGVARAAADAVADGESHRLPIDSTCLADLALPADGLVYADRLAGLEHWVESGIVTVNYMKWKGESPPLILSFAAADLLRRRRREEGDLLPPEVHGPLLCNLLQVDQLARSS